MDADKFTLVTRLNNSNAAEWFPRTEAVLVKKKLWTDIIDIVVSRTKADGSDKTKAEYAAEFKSKADSRDPATMAEARAELILRVDGGQLPYMTSSDPREIWLALQRMHRAAGFATSLALRRQFLTSKKRDDQSMEAWIGYIQAMVIRMKYAGINVTEQDKILAFTMGLPAAYEAVIINFDATPPDQLTVEHVISRLLNEETRQASAAISAATGTSANGSPAPDDIAYAARRQPDLTCFWCDKKGHVKNDCPERQAYLAGKKAASGSTAYLAHEEPILFADHELEESDFLEW
uniref:CCHC-type domain-containing protein n=1 Tax=Mycena chlorophos TaxID=658473 RepID=A0ABQ0KYM6_MYCCL|nr:predicted protein [Mycena chlorophos]